MTDPIWKSMIWYPPIEVIIQTFDMARVRLELSKRNWHIVSGVWNDTTAQLRFEYRTAEERARLLGSSNIVDIIIGSYGIEASGVNKDEDEVTNYLDMEGLDLKARSSRIAGGGMWQMTGDNE